jgi:hypothetical protein
VGFTIITSGFEFSVHTPIMLGNQQQRLHRGQPFFGVVFGLRQFGDVFSGVAQRD